MPHFDEQGRGTWLCQVCTNVYHDGIESQWRPDITGHESAGNACPDCVRRFEAQKQSSTSVLTTTAARVTWITAKYSSQCPACRVAIKAGDKIGKRSVGSVFVCARCAIIPPATTQAQRVETRRQERAKTRCTRCGGSFDECYNAFSCDQNIARKKRSTRQVAQAVEAFTCEQIEF